MNKLAQILHDAYTGDIPKEYAKMSKKEREDKVRKEILNTLGLETYSKKGFRKAWRLHKNEVYAIQEDVVDQVIKDGEFKKNSFFDQFVEVKTNDLGDTNEFYVEGVNRLEMAEFSGEHFNLRKHRIDGGQKFPVEVRNYGCAVFDYFDRIASGRSDLASLTVLISDAVERKLAKLAQATFAQAINNLPSALNVGGSYNEQSILDMLSIVEGANEAKPILVGTANALRKLQGLITAKSDNMKDEINRNGLLTFWNGYQCVEIAQGIELGSLKATMSDKDIYALVGGEKPVKMFLEGDTEVREVTDGMTNADRSVEQEVVIKVGCAVCYNKLIGHIALA